MTEPNEALKRLLHEVRSPLAAIYTAGLLMEELPESTPLGRVQRQISLIKSCVEEARKTVEEAEELLGPGAPGETDSGAG